MIYQRQIYNKGFITLQTISLIGIFCFIFLSFSFLSFIVQSKMQFHKICIQEAIQLQKQIVHAEKKLFLLNPLSSTLQTQLLLAQIQLATAVLSGNSLEIARLQWQIRNLKNRQYELDSIQKKIILTTNQFTQLQINRITQRLNTEVIRLSIRWAYFLNSFFHIIPIKKTKMAVVEKTSDIAPNYGLSSRYSYEQLVAFKWQLNVLTKTEIQKIVELNSTFQLSCGATLNAAEDQWNIEIKKGKFY